MTTVNRLTFISFASLSCSTGDRSPKPTTSKSPDTSYQIQADTLSTISDTVIRFSVDNYPVPEKLLDDKTSNNSSSPRQSGDIHSFEKVWFTNDALNQTLVFQMYTDNHRLVTFHFYNNDIPDALIKRMELQVMSGALASLAQKKKHFKGFINSATKIDSKYFTTYKGFSLGDSSQKALSVYGSPDKNFTSDILQVLEWGFVGDIPFNGKADLKGKPLAKDSYGNHVTMFFKNNKLIAMILFSEIQ